MVDNSRKPSRNEFVVYFRRGSKSRRMKIPGFREMGPLEQDQSERLVRTVRTVRDPRRAWERLQAALPDAIVVPTLVDDAGNTFYPTGTVQVRFAEPPAQQMLDDLAEEFALAGVTRNKYQPAQVSCRPTDPAGCYLPELIDSLAALPGVRKAWAEARSRYERL